MFSQLNPYIYSVRSITEESPPEVRDTHCRILYSRSATFTVELMHESVKFYKNSFLYLPPHTEYSIGAIATGEDAVEIVFDLYCGRAQDPDEVEEKNPFAEREIWFADAMQIGRAHV